MLDFGFGEIVLTSFVALLVLGPEKLPKVARQVGNWMGRARVMARQLTEQLEREVNAEELLKAQTQTRRTYAADDMAREPVIAPPKASIPAPLPLPDEAARTDVPFDTATSSALPASATTPAAMHGETASVPDVNAQHSAPPAA